MFKEVAIDYDFSIFLNADYNQHEGSCVKHQVYELTDIHEKFGGFPNTFCLENTKIHQLWWTADDIDFSRLGSQLGMEIITVSSILQPPGNVIPLHRDTFFQIKKRYPNDTRKKVRANMYLEDWKVGHIIQYSKDSDSNEWANHTHWKAGQGLLWDESILHIGANIGLQNKYTLQISGFLNE
jgi:hypothetical protein